MYAISSIIIVLGLASAYCSTRMVKGVRHVLPLIGSCALVAAGVGLGAAEHIRRNPDRSFDGSEIEWMATWLPLVGFGIVGVVVIVIAIKHYSNMNKSVQVETDQSRRTEEVEDDLDILSHN